MDSEFLANIKSRIERCRRLAREMGDPRTRKILNDMADEGQADLDRFLALRAGRSAQTAEQSADEPIPRDGEHARGEPDKL